VFARRLVRNSSWKAFGDDPEWRAVHAKSEANGTLVAKIESVFMNVADYSPPIRFPKKVK
jgi:hypothetical protein